MNQKAPRKLAIDERDIFFGDTALNYDAIVSLDKAIKASKRRKYENKKLVKEYDETHQAEQVSDELKTHAIAEKLGAKVGTCPNSWLHGSDSAGHRFAKELYCGAEWCPVCGKKDSVSHNRRFESWLPKAQQTKHLGLFVIELPLSSRNKFRSRFALQEAGKLAVKVLTGEFEVAGRRKRGEILRRGEVAKIKAKYFSRGMRRWHYFGEVEKELQKFGLQDLFSYTNEPDILSPQVKSNVHLNCLVDAGFIPKKWLNHIQNTLKIAFNEPNLIVHYGYVTKPGQMVHLLKYTTRATFLDYTWDPWLAGQLYGFRNMRSWGVWKDDPVWELPEADIGANEAENMLKRRSISESKCYKDGLLIRWSKPRPISELRGMENVIDLGSGYYELESVKPCPRFVESKQMEFNRLVLQLNANLQRQEQWERYRSTLPDAIKWSLMPEIIASKHYKHGELTSGSHEVAPWGGGS